VKIVVFEEASLPCTNGVVVSTRICAGISNQMGTGDNIISGCNAEGGSPFAIMSLKQSYAIRQLLGNRENWIGYNYKYNIGFTWVDGSQSMYTNWGSYYQSDQISASGIHSNTSLQALI